MSETMQRVDDVARVAYHQGRTVFLPMPDGSYDARNLPNEAEAKQAALMFTLTLNERGYRCAVAEGRPS